jgi:tetratricopeptide (TPR) repeat protein
MQNKHMIIIMMILISCYGCFPKTCPVCIKDGTQYGWTGRNFLGEWDDYYACGLSYIEGRCFDKAIWALKEAIKQRKKDQWKARSYGMHFVDYFPHRELGFCYYQQGQYQKALHELDLSILQEQTDKANYYRDLVLKLLMEQDHQLPQSPEITLDVPDRILSNKDSITISGTIIDSQFVQHIFIAEKSYLIESSDQKIFFTRKLALPEGHHNISITAINLLGGLTQKTISIDIDRSGPVLIVQNYTPNKQLKGTITDASPGITLTMNGNPVSLSNEKTVFFNIALTGQSTDIKLLAIDSLGNKTLAILKQHVQISASNQLYLASNKTDCIADNGERAFMVKHSQADIQLYGWASNNTVFKKIVSIEGEIVSHIPVCYLSINSIPVVNQTAQMIFFSQAVELDEGNNCINIQARTINGNLSQKNFFIRRKIPDVFHIQQRLGFLLHPFEKYHQHSEIKKFQDILCQKMLLQKRFQLYWQAKNQSIFKELNKKKDHSKEKKSHDTPDIALFGYCQITRSGFNAIIRLVNIKSSKIIAIKDVYSTHAAPQGMDKMVIEMLEKISRIFPLMEGSFRFDGDDLLIQAEKWIPEKKTLTINTPLIVFQRFKEHMNPLTEKSLGYDTKILGITHVYKRLSHDMYRSKAIDIDCQNKSCGVLTR